MKKMMMALTTFLISTSSFAATCDVSIHKYDNYELSAEGAIVEKIEVSDQKKYDIVPGESALFIEKDGSIMLVTNNEDIIEAKDELNFAGKIGDKRTLTKSIVVDCKK